MRLNELRELIQLVLLEDETPKKKKRAAKKPAKEAPPLEPMVLSADEIMLGLKRNLETSTLHGVRVFTPYRVRQTITSGWRDGALTKLDPFKVASTVKYKTREDKGKELSAEEGAADLVIDNMAIAIKQHFEDENILIVSCVDSSHGMAAALAEKVAALLDVQYQPIIKKTMDSNVGWDPDEWKAYMDQVHRTKANGNGDPLIIKTDMGDMPATPDEYLEHTMTIMKRERDQAQRLIKRGEKPSLVRMMNMKTGHKSLFNLFDKIASDTLPAGSKVLIVDDNVDSGWTPYHVAKRAHAAGLRPLFAAGFKMMRYSDKKPTASKASGHIATPELDKTIDDMSRLADEFAVDLFQIGSLVMAMSDSAEYSVEAAEVFEVMKAGPAEVVLKDIDTSKIVRLSAKDLAPDQAHHMWASAA